MEGIGKGENTMTNLTNSLNVVKTPLNVMYDYNEAQNVLSLGEDWTAKINAHKYYQERIENDFVGVYHTTVARHEDYDRFKAMLENYLYWEEDKKMEIPTYEQWKTGIIENTVIIDNAHFKGEKKVQIRLGKALQKAGIKQSIIDFYSEQVKTEKDVIIAISDRPQHIAGMTAYSVMGDWGGFGGTSCQDTRHNDDLAMDLAGSLWDDRVLVAMMVDNEDDLWNMDDKLIARAVMRIQHIEDEQFLLGNKNYGNTENRNLLSKALDTLNEYRIYSGAIHSYDNHEDEVFQHQEEANGKAHVIYETMEEVYVHEDIDSTVTCDCIACEGTGTYSVYVRAIDEDRDVTCPRCNGEGTTEEYICDTIDEYIDIEVKEDMGRWTGYDGEGHYHYGDYTMTYVNFTTIRNDRVKFGRKLF
jgi:hypothetical protein